MRLLINDKIDHRCKYSFMVTKTFPRCLFSSHKTLPCIWKAWSESCKFPCSFLRTGPRQWWAFTADTTPFVDTGRLVVIITTENLVIVRWESQFLTTIGFLRMTTRRPMSTKGYESSQKALRWWGPAKRKEQGNGRYSLQTFQKQGRVFWLEKDILEKIWSPWKNIYPCPQAILQSGNPQIVWVAVRVPRHQPQRRSPWWVNFKFTAKNGSNSGLS